MIVNIAEAETQLSKLIERVYRGETVTIAKNNLPVVDLVIHQSRGKRRLGLARGLATATEDAFASDDRFTEGFYSSPEIK